jgi:hypothetical protein
VSTKPAAAHTNNISLRWFDDYIGINLLICNPTKPDGWMHISVAMPILESEWQPNFRLEKTQFPESFNKIYKAFERMWEESVLPDLAESPTALTITGQSKLKIDYRFEEVPHEGYFNWYQPTINEPSIQRYKIKIVNSDSEPIEHVEVKLEIIEEIKIDEAGNIEQVGLPPKQVGYPLTFEKSGTRSIRLLGGDSEWVPVLSYVHRGLGWVSIEGIDKGGIDTEGKIMSPYTPHRIKIVARGHGTKEDTASFIVKLDDLGGTSRLIMKML